MQLGRIIAEERENCGLSQRSLAKKLNITHGSISQWESGYSTPSLIDAFRLENILMIKDGAISKKVIDEAYFLATGQKRVEAQESSKTISIQPIAGASMDKVIPISANLLKGFYLKVE